MRPILVPSCAVGNPWPTPSVPKSSATHLQNIDSCPFVIYDYLFGENLPHTRAEVVTFIFVARICWDVQLVHLCQGNPTKVVEHGPCINSLCCCWDPEGIVILGEEVWVVEHHRKDCWRKEEKQLCIVIVRPNA